VRYPDKWQGRLSVRNNGSVWWDDEEIGRVESRHEEGARSPGGMPTNTVWFAMLPDGSDRTKTQSKTRAIDHLIFRHNQRQNA